MVQRDSSGRDHLCKHILFTSFRHTFEVAAPPRGTSSSDEGRGSPRSTRATATARGARLRVRVHALHISLPDIIYIRMQPHATPRTPHGRRHVRLQTRRRHRRSHGKHITSLPTDHTIITQYCRVVLPLEDINGRTHSTARPRRERGTCRSRPICRPASFTQASPRGCGGPMGGAAHLPSPPPSSPPSPPSCHPCPLCPPPCRWGAGWAWRGR